MSTTQLEQAKKNLREFGFTAITPAIYAELLEAGELDISDKLTGEKCEDCGAYLLEGEISYHNRCGSCAWFRAMEVLS